MGRRERPLDPTEGPVARFAHELRKLRQEAGGPTYRAMAARAHYSTAALAQAAAGDRLPSLLAFRPDCAYLAVGEGAGRVVLWDGRLGRRLGVLADPETATYQYVSALAFAPDGRTLAVAGDEGTLQLWDEASRRRVGSPLPTPGDTVSALVFGRNGDSLHAMGNHTPPQTYPVGADGAAGPVCRRAGGGLTRDEWSRHLPDVPYRRNCDY
ncbi:hypothetical protein AB0D34_02605 [Streptomyces sp. NPDC048420]|uniref:WD40 repeat domain-containing protein n=1 Tax=Streptomyces sp. NPDC048420 TaxID=3155755 RepID=UPI00342C68DB